jgi:hypothetical protein
MSKRAIEELTEDFFDVPISLGSIANLEQATSHALAEYSSPQVRRRSSG